MPPDRGLADKRNPGVKGRKVRLTYAFTINADGSEKLQPLVIGKAKKPRAFGRKSGAQLGFYYWNNAKAWMTTDIYQEWLKDWDQKLATTDRKILLIVDNFSGHTTPRGLKNIEIVHFEPNLTSHVQPADQGIICCFKAHYRSRYIKQAISRYDSGTTPGEIYDINQLEAMRLADAAWQEVDTTTIRHCWMKAGILPSSVTTVTETICPSVPISSLVHNADPQMDPVLHAENQLQDVLDDLESTGCLQSVNRMDIEGLLNPAEESVIIDDTTDQEIYEAVMAS